MTDVTEPPEAAVLLAVADAVTALRNEETRRALMYAQKNVQKDAPFNIGDTVFDYSLRSSINPSGAVAVVIGLCGRVTNPSEGFIMAYWFAFLDEVEHNLRVFFYIRQKPQRLQSVNQALYLSVEILQPRLPARVSWVESWYLTPSTAYQWMYRSADGCWDDSSDQCLVHFANGPIGVENSPMERGGSRGDVGFANPRRRSRNSGVQYFDGTNS